MKILASRRLDAKISAIAKLSSKFQVKTLPTIKELFWLYK